MSEAEYFIEEFEGHHRAVMRYFHNLLTKELGLTVKMRYKLPFYYKKIWICYINPLKHGVEFAFTRGNELSNAQGLLLSKGRKQVYSIEFEKVSDIPEQEILQILQEALLLDDTKAYESKRKKKGL